MLNTSETLDKASSSGEAFSILLNSFAKDLSFALSITKETFKDILPNATIYSEKE